MADNLTAIVENLLNAAEAEIIRGERRSALKKLNILMTKFAAWEDPMPTWCVLRFADIMDKAL